MYLCSTVPRAEYGICSCVTDKIEEAQKELKDPKSSQKGKILFSTLWILSILELNIFLKTKLIDSLSFIWKEFCKRISVF